MNKGIIFFTDWDSAVPLLIVALHSLEKHYSGNIHVFYGPNTPAIFQHALQKNRRITSQLVIPNYNAISCGENRKKCWLIKPELHNQCPFDVNLIYDCDHVFINKIDETIFAPIIKNGLTSYTMSPSQSGAWRGRRNQLRTRIIKNELRLPIQNTIPTVNGGCVGSVKGTPLIKEWGSVMTRFALCRNGWLDTIPDEFSLGYILSKYNLTHGDEKYSRIISHKNPNPYIQEAFAIHLVGYSYEHNSCFKKALLDAFHADYMSIRTHWEIYQLYNSVVLKSFQQTNLGIVPVRYTLPVRIA